MFKQDTSEQSQVTSERIVRNEYLWRLELREDEKGVERLYVSVMFEGRTEEKELSEIRQFLHLMEDCPKGAPGASSALAFANFVSSTVYWGGFASNPVLNAGGLAGFIGKRKSYLEWNWPKDVQDLAHQIRKRLG